MTLSVYVVHHTSHNSGNPLHYLPTNKAYYTDNDIDDCYYMAQSFMQRALACLASAYFKKTLGTKKLNIKYLPTLTYSQISFARRIVIPP